jgi:heat shock protein HtpX
MTTMENIFKTGLLLGLLTALLVLIGAMLGGRQGMMIAFVFAAGMNFFSYWFSDKIVLKMHRAVEASPNRNPELYGIVQGLSQNAGIPMPRVFIIPDQSPNAFATGRNPEHAVVAVTEGLLGLMKKEEITGVIAHELAHVKNRDILIGSIAATMAGAVMILANMARWAALFGGGGNNDGERSGVVGMIVLSILAPLAALMVQMAVSRSREYHADATGARISGNPSGLASALEKLGAYSKRLPMKKADPSSAHMFIVNPLSGRSMASLFSTHPPIEERIARLRGRAPVTGSGGEMQPDAPDGRRRAQDTWRRLSR